MSAEHRDDPLLIGAVGGSGTRVFVAIAGHAGIHMGSRVSHRGDAKRLSPFYRSFLRPYLEHAGNLPESSRLAADELFDELIARHLKGLRTPMQPWGAKNPRAMLMLPYWRRHYPRLRFLHVIRSGLDMAFSDNDNQLGRYGDLFLSAAELGAPKSHAAIKYWEAANLSVADYGERELGDRYLRVRFEDLCARPLETTREVLGFLGVSDAAVADAAAAEVAPPATLERWREQDPATTEVLRDLAAEGLGRLGYLAQAREPGTVPRLAAVAATKSGVAARSGTPAPPPHRPDPLVIGGLGGSGTRVFSRIARLLGRFMGSEVDGHEDAKPFSDFYRTWIRTYLAGGGRLEGEEASAAHELFSERVARHLADLPGPDHPWGAKNPRSMLMLDFWHERYPQLRFLHVIRNGLDMAYSANFNQLRNYGDLVLGEDQLALPKPRASVLFWEAVNGAAADFGEATLGERYLQIRFEDLCEDPGRSIAELAEFLGVDPAPVLDSARAEVKPPMTLERWRGRPAAELDELVELARRGFERFGYAERERMNAG